MLKSQSWWWIFNLQHACGFLIKLDIINAWDEFKPECTRSFSFLFFFFGITVHISTLCWKVTEHSPAWLGVLSRMFLTVSRLALKMYFSASLRSFYKLCFKTFWLNIWCSYQFNDNLWVLHCKLQQPGYYDFSTLALWYKWYYKWYKAHILGNF